VFFWYVGVSVLGVWVIFRSRGIDYRLVAVGALVPLLIDLPWGRPALGHTLAFSVGLLVVVMLATVGRPRLVRRQWLCLVIGVFAGLILSGAWTSTEVLMWPTLGWEFPPGALVPAWWVVIIEEFAGLVAIWMMVGIGSLYEEGPRRVFLRTGRIEAVPA